MAGTNPADSEMLVVNAPRGYLEVPEQQTRARIAAPVSQPSSMKPDEQLTLLKAHFLRQDPWYCYPLADPNNVLSMADGLSGERFHEIIRVIVASEARTQLLVQQVFSIPELLAKIVVESFEPPKMLPLMAVCKLWRHCIISHPSVRKKFFYDGVKASRTLADLKLTKQVWLRSPFVDTHSVSPNAMMQILTFPEQVTVHLGMVSQWHATKNGEAELLARFGPPITHPRRWNRCREALQIKVWAGREAYDILKAKRRARNTKTPSPEKVLLLKALWAYEKRRKRTCKELCRLHPMLPVPFGPHSMGAPITEAVKVESHVWVKLPRQTLEILDSMAAVARQNNVRASWMDLPLTLPPVSALALWYYYPGGGQGDNSTVLVSQVIDVSYQTRPVVLADLVGLIRRDLPGGV